MSLTLEEFQELSAEIEHLVRAGMPLEQSLAAASRGRGQRLAEIGEKISAELKSGESLHDILSRKELGAPRMLSSAIAAGIRSNNLAMTIEMMGDFAADVVTLRQRLLSACTYPLTIVATAGLLMTCFTTFGLQRIYGAIIDMELNVSPWMMSLLYLNAAYPEWLLILPLSALLILIYWAVTGRASTLTFRGPERMLLLIPGIGSLVRDLQHYTMSRMIGLLVKNKIPLDEAVVLAGGACGSAALQAAAEAAAKSIQRGDSLKTSSTREINVPADALDYQAVMSHYAQGAAPGKGLPPLLAAGLAQADRDESRLAVRLSSIAEFYRGRLDRNAAWLNMLMPFVAFVVIGGGCVIVYAATVFWPTAELYRNIGQ